MSTPEIKYKTICGHSPPELDDKVNYFLQTHPSWIIHGPITVRSDNTLMQTLIAPPSSVPPPSDLDRFLHLFQREIECIPELGTAYKQALESFYQNKRSEF